ncbi:MAG: hypothetical protein KJZ91_28230 [Myxococcales bacterium]|nr:hypothetical protein [Myxococcales bacterium]
MRARPASAALALLGLAWACGPPAPPAAPARDHVEDLVDRDDRCPYLPPECLAGFAFEDDGCPDPPPPVIEPAGLATVARSLVAAEATRLAAGARLVVVVERGAAEPAPAAAARGAALRDAFLARGVPAAQVEVATVAATGPVPRVVLAVEGCAFVPAQLDADGDRVPDHRDACPDDPEDLDGHLDDDGCPDLDHACHPVDPAAADGTCGDGDHDGVLDPADRCPAAPGPAAAAGCPSPRAPSAYVARPPR